MATPWVMSRSNRQAKAKTPLDTLDHLKAETRWKALVDTLAETVPDAKAKTPLDTLGDMNSEALMHRLAETLAEAEHELL